MRVAIFALLLSVIPTWGNADSPSNPVVRLETTLGNIDIELNPGKAPQTSASILNRVSEGFYDGLIFHRVLANFVIQTGGYLPDLDFRAPPGNVPNESHNGLSNLKGTVAMARLADPDSADTQFFINVKDNPHLDATDQPGYTVFGKVVAGWETVVDIELTEVGSQQGMVGVPTTPIVIERAYRL